MSLFCYNRGCQKNYTPSDDPSKDEVACQYHPGLPYFHDAYKIWSCCQKKSHDFSTFLSLPGCQRGPHQPNKIVESTVSRPEEQETIPKPASTLPLPESKKVIIERPSPDTPLVEMKLTVSASLKSALEKLAESPQTALNQNQQETDEIKPGAPCRHTACGARYTTVNQEQMTRCQYHPGVAIFHEGSINFQSFTFDLFIVDLGMKYWSCCQRKTTDFEAFTSQPGCTEGEHQWRDEKKTSTDEDDPQTLKTACRYDFHQQGPTVTLSIYAKMPRPEHTCVELNAGRLKIDTRFGTDNKTKRFANDWTLFGLVNVEQSTVELLQTKIEIILKKAEPLSWSRLDLPVS